ncbi:MAG: hypothetical protein IGR92_02905 [Leptolyngbyaceae cyanobacterium T60_A2020_046]|nr:hypothetical protein [Leptolyngbyaceae cyanobacterium T60_A2020_046]
MNALHRLPGTRTQQQQQRAAQLTARLAQLSDIVTQKEAEIAAEQSAQVAFRVAEGGEKYDQQGNLESAKVVAFRRVESETAWIQRILGRAVGGKKTFWCSTTRPTTPKNASGWESLGAALPPNLRRQSRCEGAQAELGHQGRSNFLSMRLSYIPQFRLLGEFVLAVSIGIMAF